MQLVDDMCEEKYIKMNVTHLQIFFAKELNYTPWLASLNSLNGTEEFR